MFKRKHLQVVCDDYGLQEKNRHMIDTFFRPIIEEYEGSQLAKYHKNVLVVRFDEFLEFEEEAQGNAIECDKEAKLPPQQKALLVCLRGEKVGARFVLTLNEKWCEEVLGVKPRHDSQVADSDLDDEGELKQISPSEFILTALENVPRKYNGGIKIIYGQINAALKLYFGQDFNPTPVHQSLAKSGHVVLKKPKTKGGHTIELKPVHDAYFYQKNQDLDSVDLKIVPNRGKVNRSISSDHRGDEIQGDPAKIFFLRYLTSNSILVSSIRSSVNGSIFAIKTNDRHSIGREIKRPVLQWIEERSDDTSTAFAYVEAGDSDGFIYLLTYNGRKTSDNALFEQCLREGYVEWQKSQKLIAKGAGDPSLKSFSAKEVLAFVLGEDECQRFLELKKQESRSSKKRAQSKGNEFSSLSSDEQLKALRDVLDIVRDFAVSGFVSGEKIPQLIPRIAEESHIIAEKPRHAVELLLAQGLIEERLSSNKSVIGFDIVSEGSDRSAKSVESNVSSDRRVSEIVSPEIIHYLLTRCIHYAKSGKLPIDKWKTVRAEVDEKFGETDSISKRTRYLTSQGYLAARNKGDSRLGYDVQEKSFFFVACKVEVCRRIDENRHAISTESPLLSLKIFDVLYFLFEREGKISKPLWSKWVTSNLDDVDFTSNAFVTWMKGCGVICDSLSSGGHKVGYELTEDSRAWFDGGEAQGNFVPPAPQKPKSFIGKIISSVTGQSDASDRKSEIDAQIAALEKERDQIASDEELLSDPEIQAEIKALLESKRRK